jgi:hypothetical protein
MGDGVFAATVGMGHGRLDVLRGGGRWVCVSAGEGPGVDEEVGEAAVGMGTGADADADTDADADADGTAGGAVVGVEGVAPVSPSFSRRRLVPREVLSLRPSEVALIRI